MMYRVIRDFTDAQDGFYLYRTGDVFPRDGMEPTETRIAELSGNKNRIGEPLIVSEKKDAEKPKKRHKAAESED